MVAASEARDFTRLAAVLHRDGTIVGLLTLGQITLGPMRSAAASWWIGVGHEGRGYGREAVGLLLDHAFRDRDLNRVEANIRTGNDRSRRLAASLGFRHEGLSPEYLEIDGAFRDHDRFAILRREWLGRPRNGSNPPVAGGTLPA
jgi:ribosomal-protein-alanine N-acetyltransferase